MDFANYLNFLGQFKDIWVNIKKAICISFDQSINKLLFQS